MRRILVWALATGLSLAAGPALAAKGSPEGSPEGSQVRVTGEIIDSWCYLSEIMYPLGTAHHQCALWCAVGGIPVGIVDAAGVVHILLQLPGEEANVEPAGVLRMQSHRVTFEGRSIERDGVRYLLVSKLVEDEGIVNQTHAEYGIQPFGD
jgi:hypothetical protein